MSYVTPEKSEMVNYSFYFILSVPLEVKLS